MHTTTIHRFEDLGIKVEVRTPIGPLSPSSRIHFRAWGFGRIPTPSQIHTIQERLGYHPNDYGCYSRLYNPRFDRATWGCFGSCD